MTIVFIKLEGRIVSPKLGLQKRESRSPPSRRGHIENAINIIRQIKSIVIHSFWLSVMLSSFGLVKEGLAPPGLMLSSWYEFWLRCYVLDVFSQASNAARWYMYSYVRNSIKKQGWWSIVKTNFSWLFSFIKGYWAYFSVILNDDELFHVVLLWTVMGALAPRVDVTW